MYNSFLIYVYAKFQLAEQNVNKMYTS